VARFLLDYIHLKSIRKSSCGAAENLIHNQSTNLLPTAATMWTLQGGPKK